MIVTCVDRIITCMPAPFEGPQPTSIGGHTFDRSAPSVNHQAAGDENSSVPCRPPPPKQPPAAAALQETSAAHAETSTKKGGGDGNGGCCGCSKGGGSGDGGCAHLGR
eukprot:6493560-Prymnesium_polylepis.1